MEEKNNLAPTNDRVAFQLLPEAIRTWLLSEAATQIIIDINERHDIFGEDIKIIPKTIAALVIGKFPPEQLVGKIQNHLKINNGEAQQIVREVRDKILEPIADGLKTTQQINIDNILLAENNASVPSPIPQKPTPVGPATPNGARPAMDSFAPRPNPIPKPSEIRPQPQTPPAQPLKPATVVNYETPTQKPEPAKEKPIEKKELQPKVTSAPRPFMLHEERPTAPSGEAAFSSPRTAERKDFIYKAPGAPSTPKKPPAPQPATAQFNSSFNAFLKKENTAPVTSSTQRQQPKIIHYSAFRTLLDQNGQAKKQE